MGFGDIKFAREVQRTAIFLMVIGQAHASKLIAKLDEHEVEAIGACINGMGQVTREQIEDALGNFVEDIREQTAFGIDNDRYLRTLLDQALGEERAHSLIERIGMRGAPASVEALKRMDAHAVLELVREEHPQIIAVVLSLIDGKVAGAVIKQLAQSLHIDVLLRVARLDSLPPQALRELDGVLEARLAKRPAPVGEVETIGGAQTAATLINQLDDTMVEEVKEKLREADEALATKVASLMFVFEDLLGVDDRGIQTLLRDVSTDDLTIALKGASAEMNDKILRNMSSRAAELLKDDMDAKGPVRLADVEEAQSRICDTAKNLESEGKIMIGGGDDFV